MSNMPHLLANLFGTITNQPRQTAPTQMDKDRAAQMLKFNPDLLPEFEKAYAARVETYESHDLMDADSRKDAEITHAIDPDKIQTQTTCDPDVLTDMIQRITRSLLSETITWKYDPTQPIPEDPDFTQSVQPIPSGVTKADILTLPEELRPQLTEELLSRDTPDNITAETLLTSYAASQDPTESPEMRKLNYQSFRQGLDMLDLDGFTYAMLGQNPNAMSHWLPALARANRAQEFPFFRIPKTTIARVPITLLQLSRWPYKLLTQTSFDIINQWAFQAFDLNPNETYFVKTGTYSSKFNFRNAKVTTPKEVKELGEYLIYIQNQAVRMAYPLSQPTTYGVSTTNEFVVREFIPDKENNPCIYQGLPLHTEYRVFIDCDTEIVLGMTPYWEPSMMKDRFSNQDDKNSPHKIHDYIIYKSHEDVLAQRYEQYKELVYHKVQDLLPDLNLTGQWSLDIMQNGEDFWLIDMAVAESSNFYLECVPKELRRPQQENWIPALPQNHKP